MKRLSNKQRKVQIKAARLQRQEKQRLAALRVESVVPNTPPSGAVSCIYRSDGYYGVYGMPDFIKRGYYIDEPFVCKDCREPGVWTAQAQKWWYEVANGPLGSRAVRCKTCRAKERARKEEARRQWAEGMQRKSAAVKNKN